MTDQSFEGSLMVHIYDPETKTFKRALRTFVLPFQPHVGMVLGTGTTEIVIDELEWSLEHGTFHAIVYIVEDSQCGEGDFINPAWSLKDLDPVDGYVEKFYARRPQYVEKITQCPSCNGTGLGTPFKGMLGTVTPACEWCKGLKMVRQTG